MSIATSHDKQISAFIERWGVPFARALAEFVRAATESSPAEPKAGTPQGRRIAKFTQISRAQDPAAYAYVDRLLAEHRAQEKAPAVIFDPAIPPMRAGIRLKEAFQNRGIKQTAIARKLRVSPSVISRVLQNPARSRLDTIQKIAKAAGIPLMEIM